MKSVSFSKFISEKSQRIVAGVCVSVCMCAVGGGSIDLSVLCAVLVMSVQKLR